MKLHFKRAMVIFLFIELVLCVFVVAFNESLNLNKTEYFGNYNFIEEQRLGGKRFVPSSAFAVYDSQFYLKIARFGYSSVGLKEDTQLNGKDYAFFPFYPLLIWFTSLLISNLLLSAFLTTFLLRTLGFASLYYVVSKEYGEKLGLRTALLVFTFPLSIVFRGYYSDTVYLLILVWFLYFLRRKDFLKSALALGILNVTRGVGWMLNFLFLYLYFREERPLKSRLNVLSSAFLLCAPMALWMGYNYMKTGDLLHFINIRGDWPSGFPFSLIYNTKEILAFRQLSFHEIWSSKISTAMFLMYGFVVYKSRKVLNKVDWYASLLILAFPFFVNILNARFQVVNFPMFVYLAKTLNDWQYLLVFCLFWGLLLITSLYFVNWYWVG